MKNRFFKEMRQAGTRFRLGKLPARTPLLDQYGIAPPYSQGQSFAFRAWAIADNYNANEIVIDDVPCDYEIPVMLETFERAGISSIAVRGDQQAIIRKLQAHGCIPVRTCKVIREGSDIYTAGREVINAIQLRLKPETY